MENMGYTESLVCPIDIRWLTKYKVVERVLKLYPFVMLALAKLDKSKDKTATELLKELKDLKTVGHMKILTDLYEIIDPINNIFQKKNISIKQLKISYNLAVHSLSHLTLNNNYGPLFESFSEKIVQNNYKFCGIKLLHNEGDLEFLKKRSNDLAKLILFDLESRFQDLDVLEKLEIISFENLNKLKHENAYFHSYGKQEIEYLSKHFNLNTQNCLKAWNKIKIFKFSDKTIPEEEFWRLVLDYEEFRSIRTIVETFLTLPLSTVECERTFSKLSLIKTKLRNKMSTDTLGAYLEISLKGPPIEKFDFEQAIEDWKLSKKRKFI